MYYGTDFSVINKLIDKFNNDLKQMGGTDDIEVYVFPQGWGSTALGYSGIGGSAMTSSHTIVLHAFHTNIVRVYFGGSKIAYEIKNPTREFFEDLYNHNLVCQSKAGKYRRKIESHLSDIVN